MVTTQQHPETTAGGQLDPRNLRDTLGMYASGITVIGGHDETAPLGFTCQSFHSVSLDPPLVSFSVMLTSKTYPLIRDTGRFSVNVLSNEQHQVSDQFARSGSDKWAGIRWSRTQHGNPVIAETLMWLDCAIEDEHIAGDHSIVIGRVVETSPRDWSQGEPLMYFRSQYRQLGMTG